MCTSKPFASPLGWDYIAQQALPIQQSTSRSSFAYTIINIACSVRVRLSIEMESVFRHTWARLHLYRLVQTRPTYLQKKVLTKHRFPTNSNTSLFSCSASKSDGTLQFSALEPIVPRRCCKSPILQQDGLLFKLFPGKDV